MDKPKTTQICLPPKYKKGFSSQIAVVASRNRAAQIRPPIRCEKVLLKHHEAS